ncbi:hypothetical protein RZS28_10540 [Methylocapsa polymorpha]|uniref:Uncharacterized protein n=1 Tax=Methylocapsa polymorpha TaxID=3080828 RepID=A0ABZ0HLV3_9HYPH|nr:hypothetical protein RZS28_10540 [Methylocapsa sp. RX1]
MPAIAQERPRAKFRSLHVAEDVSGGPVVNVINTNTSDAYLILSSTQMLLNCIIDMAASTTILSGSGVSYSLTISTYPAQEKYDRPQEEYDPAFVSMLIQADAGKPEAEFTNVIDMIEWLDRT